MPFKRWFFFSDECQTCDCVSQFMGETGVYGIVIGGDLKKMYCSFEESYTWTVRKALALKYNGGFFKKKPLIPICNVENDILIFWKLCVREGRKFYDFWNY